MIAVGQRFGEFEILERIGEDGVSVTCKAHDTSQKRVVVLRVLRAQVAANSEYLSRFYADARIAAELRHPDIVQVFGAGETNGLHWLATEFVEGTTAEARIKRKGHLAIPEALAIATHIATVLDYGWRKAQLIHRDVEPGNIFLSKKSEVKLRGLGLAKSAGEIKSIELMGAPMGAPHYMSPEQAEGRPDVDLRADVYGLGCTLFHFISGETPYSGDTAMAVILKHVTSPVPELHRVFPACPVGISRVVSKMMQKQPEARYQTYDELIADLRGCYELLTNPPVPQADSPAPSRAPAAVIPVREAASVKVVPVESAPLLAKRVVVDEPWEAHGSDAQREESTDERKPLWNRKPIYLAAAVVLVGAMVSAIVSSRNRGNELTEAERGEKLRNSRKDSLTSKASEATTPVQNPKPAPPVKKQKPTPAKIGSSTPAPVTPNPTPATPAEPSIQMPAEEKLSVAVSSSASVPAVPQTAMGKWLSEQEAQWQATLEAEATAPFEKSVADLKARYQANVDTALRLLPKNATSEGAALRAERDHLTEGKEIPESDESNVSETLKGMRVEYRSAFAALEAERVSKVKSVFERFDAALVQAQKHLLQARRQADAAEVQAKRDEVRAVWLKFPEASGGVAVEVPRPVSKPPREVPSPSPTPAKLQRLTRKELAQRLLSLGAVVRIGSTGSSMPLGKLEDLPEDRFSIVEVEFKPRDGMSEADLSLIEQLTEVETLVLEGVPATDSTLRMIRGLPVLRTLRLRDLGKLTVAGFRSIAASPMLQTLNVRGPVSGESLVALAVNRNIDTLALSDTTFSEHDLAAIAASPALKSLTIATSAPVPPAAWSRLTSAKKLKKLTIENTPKTAETIEHVSRLSTLTDLSLGDVTLSDAELGPLGALKSLQVLQTGGGSTIEGSFCAAWTPHRAMKTLTLRSKRGVNDKILRIIATVFPNLSHLEVTASAANVTPASFAQLASARALDSLSISGDAVDAAALSQLAGLAKIRHLGIGKARIADVETQLLARFGSLRELEWSNPPVSEVALKNYAKMHSLVMFKVGPETKTEAEGALKAALPTVRITR